MSDEIKSQELLARVDERTKSIQTEMAGIRVDLKQSVEIFSNKLTAIENKSELRINVMKEDLDTRMKEIETNYVKKEEFGPVRILVYGFVGLILVAVVGALIATVVSKVNN